MASSQDIRRSQRNRRLIDYKLLHSVGLSDNKAEEEKSMEMNKKLDANRPTFFAFQNTKNPQTLLISGLMYMEKIFRQGKFI